MSEKQATSPRQAPDPRQTDRLRLRSLTPALTVADLPKSLAWYRDVVGFFVAETWEHEDKVVGAELKAGSVSLMLAQDDFAKGRDRVKGLGFRMHLSTAQDVDEIAAGIEKRGGKIESQPAEMPWGARAFSVVDPDGYKLTVSSAE